MTERSGLLIGEFARRCRLPVSTLRYYDQIGLLTPAMVDSATGYRRYTFGQLRTAVLISQLRSIGISPTGIRQIVAGGLAASAELVAQRRRIESEIATRRQALDHIDEFLRGIRSENYRVDLVELPRRRVSALPFRIPLADLEEGLVRAIARLRSLLRRCGYRRCGAWGATFPLEPAGEVNGVVFAPVDHDKTDEFPTIWMPRAPAVRIVHQAGADTLPLAYHVAFETIEGLGGSATEPVIEEYPGLDNSATVAGPILVHIPYDLDMSQP